MRKVAGYTVREHIEAIIIITALSTILLPFTLLFKFAEWKLRSEKTNKEEA